MSCRPSSRPTRAGAGGCARPAGVSTSAAPRRQGRSRARAPSGLREAKRRLEEELAVERRANDAYEAYRARGVMRDGRRFGAPPKPYQPPAAPAGKINVTDPDSRNLKTPRGYMQGYNAQAATNENQHRRRRRGHGRLAGLRPPRADGRGGRGTSSSGPASTESPEVVLADAGYWHPSRWSGSQAAGSQVIVPPDASKRKGARPGWERRALRVHAPRARHRARRERSTENARAWSSRCSRRQRAGSVA